MSTSGFLKYQKGIARILSRTDKGRRAVGVGAYLNNRFLLTCAHVIDAALNLSKDANLPALPNNSIELDFPFQESAFLKAKVFKAKVLFWKPCENLNFAGEGDDVAILEILELPEEAKNNLSPLILYSVEEPWGHEFRAAGFPRGYDRLVDWAEGEITGNQTEGWLQLKTKADGEIKEGYSGSPVWDSRVGAVIGMITATASQHKASIISACVIQKLLKQPIDLVRRLRQHCNQECDLLLLNKVYCQIQPPGHESPFPNDVREIIMTVNDMALDDQLKQSRLLSFAIGLAQQTHDLALKQSLEDWAYNAFDIESKKWRQLLGIQISNPTSQHNSVPARLYIALNNSNNLKNYYDFLAWSIVDIEQYNPEKGIGCKQLQCPLREPIAVDRISEEVPKLLDTWIREIIQHSGQDFQIEVFLPFEQLNLDVDAWQKPKSYGKSRPVGQAHSIVVRLLDRLRPEEEELRHNWLIKWQDRGKHTESSTALVCGDGPRHEVLKDLFDSNGIGLYMKSPCSVEDKSSFEIIMDEGLSIAIWLRKDLSECNNAENFQNLLHSHLEELPSDILRIRKTVSTDFKELGYHISLMWDDPTKVPPESYLFTSSRL